MRNLLLAIFLLCSLAVFVSAAVVSIGPTDGNISGVISCGDVVYLPAQNITETVSCLRNINVSISSGMVYTDSVSNVTVVAKTVDLNLSISPGQTYHDFMSNITVASLGAGINSTIAPNQALDDAQKGVHVFCNAVNLKSSTIAANTTYNDTVTGTTYSCALPTGSTATSIAAGQAITDSNTGTTYTCMLPNLGVSSLIDPGTAYNNDSLGIKVTAKNCSDNGLHDYLFNMTVGSTTYAAFNVNASCRDSAVVVNATLLGMNITNGTCVNYFNYKDDLGAQKVCVDSIQSMCTPQQIFAGDWRGCFTTYTGNLQAESDSCKSSMQTCQVELNKWQTGKQVVDESNSHIDETITTFLAVLAVVLLFVVGIMYYDSQAKVRSHSRELKPPGEQ